MHVCVGQQRARERSGANQIPPADPHGWLARFSGRASGRSDWLKDARLRNPHPRRLLADATPCSPKRLVWTKSRRREARLLTAAVDLVYLLAAGLLWRCSNLACRRLLRLCHASGLHTRPCPALGDHGVRSACRAGPLGSAPACPGPSASISAQMMRRGAAGQQGRPPGGLQEAACSPSHHWAGARLAVC